MPKNVKGDPLGFFEHQFCCKVEKIEGGPFGDIKKTAKKVSQSRNNMQKNFVKGEARTHVLLFDRPQKILFKLYAKCW